MTDIAVQPPTSQHSAPRSAHAFGQHARSPQAECSKCEQEAKKTA